MYLTKAVFVYLIFAEGRNAGMKLMEIPDGQFWYSSMKCE